MWAVAYFMWAVEVSMWTAAASMQEIADAVWDVAASTHDVHELCGLFNPLHFLRRHYVDCQCLFVGHFILCVGIFNMHVCITGSAWAISSYVCAFAACMWAIASKDRERRQRNKTWK